MSTYSEVNGKTIHGGVKLRIDFYDKDGNPCEESKSDHAVMKEFNKQREVIYECVLKSKGESIL